MYYTIVNGVYIYSHLDLNRPKNNKIPTDILHNIHDTIKRTEDEKRRLDLESRLYKKWRNGFVEDSIILDSKSDHEAMAKINWLDKQVAMQLQRDCEKRESEDRLLRFQEESRLQEEAFAKRKMYRDAEVDKLKSSQSTHLNELKQRELNSDQLVQDEHKLLKQKKDLIDELKQIECLSNRRHSEIPSSYNTRRIKMLLRQRSDDIRRNLRDDIDTLCRIGEICQINPEQVHRIKENFEMQYDLEIQKQSQIEAMYESEAKQLLPKEEEQWQNECKMREKLLTQLVKGQLETNEMAIHLNLNKQRELIDIKEQHLSALENLNEQFKMLMHEKEIDKKQNSIHLHNNMKESDTVKVTKHVQNNDVTGPHKFGKKKIAWN